MTQHDSVLGGRYQLDQVIGRGGMAEVWKALDIRLGRDVAVKRLRVDLATDPTFQARFRREAQSAAGLNHPNIVATYDTGEEADEKTGIHVPYIVMELVEGHTLRDLLRTDRRILPEKSLEWTMGVLDALNYSHRAGIIHRDIKPANVMVTPQGTVKVMDFGIARAVADTSATMTQTAAVIGTAQYLSPEQARGETVDSRSDIYSAGCLLYELLTGRPPFVGDSPVSVAYQHVREAPIPPSTLDPELTPAMDAIVLTSLAKDRTQRYQTAKQMRDDIARLLAGQSVQAGIPTPVVEAPTAVTQVVGATAAQQTGTTEAVPDAALTGTQDVITEPEKKKPTLGWVIAVLAAVLALTIGISAYKFFAPVSNDNLVAVPSVLYQNEAAATSSLESLGFAVKPVHVKQDEKTANQVVDQDPNGGQEAAKGSTVTITINDGPQTNKVPANLLAMTEKEARAALVAAGFLEANITTETASSDVEEQQVKLNPKLAKGQVASSNPAAGADVVPATQKVTLYLASGSSAVPNVVGKTQTDATAALNSAGFAKVEANTVDVSTSADIGKVTAQDPNDNEQHKRTDTITITVGKTPSKVNVPAVTGSTQAEATSVLEKAGFKVVSTTKEIDNQGEDGKVIGQDPVDVSVSPGSTVSITVGVYKAPAVISTPTPVVTPQAPQGGTTSTPPTPAATQS